MGMNNIPTEAEEQSALFAWAKWMEGQYPDLKWMYHIPNGGSRNPAEAAHLKAQGVKSGVPDICLPAPRGIYHGLYIELKRRDGGRVSANQDEWLRGLAGLGHKCMVCFGWEEARDEIVKYLAGK